MYDISITYEYPYGRVTYLRSFISTFKFTEQEATVTYRNGAIYQETINLESCVAISITKVEEE